jgi:hypothetical protein
MTHRVVNYTYGTGNPVLPDGSIDVRDGIDNLQSLDIFMNADEGAYNQRDGGIVKTRAGAVRDVGIRRIGDFTTGCTVTDRNQGVLYETDGTVYVWLGALPKVVPPLSSPATTGGISPAGDWLDIGDASVRPIIEDYKDLISSSAGYQEVGDNIIARLSTLKAKFGVAAWAQAANYNIFHIDVDDVKSTPYLVPPGQTIVFSANVTHTASSKCFDLTGSTGCYITGNGDVLGGTTRPSTQDASHFGFYVQDCLRYRIDGNITVKYFGAVGFYADGSSEVSGDVSFSSVSGVRCEENYVGWQLMNGFQQEYTTFSGCWGIRSTLANMILETGNIYWHGGGLSHGYGDGLRLQHPALGGNPHHGVFSGCEFNHNAGHNLLADKIAYGMDFADCAWFSGGSSVAGDIYINSSRGVNIDGGILGCDVRVIEDANLPHTGWNAIRNMHCFPPGFAPEPRVITGGSFSRNKLSIKNNFTNTGMWSFNDVGGAGVYANYRPAANIQMTSAAQTLKFTSKMIDDRASYDTATGFFTAPFRGVARVRVDLHLLTNSNVQTAGHHLLFFRDDGGTGTAFTQLGKQKPVAGASNTSASIAAVFEIPVSSGAKLLVQYQAPDFATQICNVEAANSSISFEMI